MIAWKPKRGKMHPGFTPKTMVQIATSSFLVFKPTARVKRAITDVHHALRAEGRQKRDVSSVEMISQLEKKADDLIKQLQIKEGG